MGQKEKNYVERPVVRSRKIFLEIQGRLQHLISQQQMKVMKRIKVLVRNFGKGEFIPESE